MEDNGERRVQSGDEDRLSNLPESLLFQVLLNLPTKDVVKSSVLSTRWRNLWRFVPGLDLKYRDFPDYNAFVSFVDMFLGFNRESYIQKLNLKFKWYDDDEPDLDNFTRWINTVVERRVQHLHVLNDTWWEEEVEIPPTVYTCESLVSLKLCDVILSNPNFVSLPSVKVMDLQSVKFANDLAFEMLISGCPVLQSLVLHRTECDNLHFLRVWSQSLMRFTLHGHYDDDLGGGQLVDIDAPMLEYLQLGDHETAGFIIKNPGSLVKADIDIVFNLTAANPNNLPKRNMIRRYLIRCFLIGISSVKVMDISSQTLEAIYDYSRYEALPLFRNLSFLCVDFDDYRWEMLPIFLESCPKLKSLSLGFTQNLEEERVSILTGSRQLLTSLEYVDIGKSIAEEETEMKLVSYFLENSTILKKFTLRLGDFRKKEKSGILNKLLTIPRLSTACQVSIL